MGNYQLVLDYLKKRENDNSNNDQIVIIIKTHTHTHTHTEECVVSDSIIKGTQGLIFG